MSNPEDMIIGAETYYLAFNEAKKRLNFFDEAICLIRDMAEGHVNEKPFSSLDYNPLRKAEEILAKYQGRVPRERNSTASH
jgi:hypothetical protein